jgi:hypothetical protein
MAASLVQEQGDLKTYSYEFDNVLLQWGLQW